MDLLKSLGQNRSLKAEKLDEENVELSLGLSSNGRFWVERRGAVANDIYDRNNRLIRSSSIADVSPETDDTTSLTLYLPLARTCSLPEVEWRKTKELQSLRRSEAKRKRAEKILNGRTVKGLLPEENCESRLTSTTSLLPLIPRPSQVSVGSLASGGSSGVSDLESQHFSGTYKDTELKSTASHQPISHQIPYRSNSTSSQIINENLPRDETLKMMFVDMPCVSTKHDGVNGKKIEGFLYRYRKGEDLRIICVCHGSFLTPAEFVKHGGGGDVEHPLRHILVIPPAL